MTDIIVVAILLMILGTATACIIKSKKSGAKCIGCPYAQSCGKQTECKCNSEK